MSVIIFASCSFIGSLCLSTGALCFWLDYMCGFKAKILGMKIALVGIFLVTSALLCYPDYVRESFRSADITNVEK